MGHKTLTSTLTLLIRLDPVIGWPFIQSKCFPIGGRSYTIYPPHLFLMKVLPCFQPWLTQMTDANTSFSSMYQNISVRPISNKYPTSFMTILL